MRCLTGVDHVSRQTCLGQERDFEQYVREIRNGL